MMKQIIILLCACANAFRPTVDRFPATKVEERISNSRRSFLASGVGCVIATPSVAHAVYGADAKIEMPDVIQGMSDRTNKQCLVESLGNRDCLVYLDPENQLYKGSDGATLFGRLSSCVSAMNYLPQYIGDKQWNKVQGVLTGPMGTLSQTMNELVKKVDDSSLQLKCKELSVDIRKDLYAIAAAADRKQANEALISYERAVKKLERFFSLVSGA